MNIDLSDVTFTIPIRIDSLNRFNNIHYVVEYLNYNFNTKIIIFENGLQRNLRFTQNNIIYRFERNNSLFYRTKILNDMAKLVTTKYIVNYDGDVIIPVNQILKTYTLLKENKADFAYPYSGLFVDVSRVEIDKEVKNFDPAILNPNKYPNLGTESVGGAVFWNKYVFMQGGMENENFVSWGWEDRERYHRFNKLNYRCSRIEGPLYHINHPRFINSNADHSFYYTNIKEYEKIENMSYFQLRDYIKTWPWCN